jgi:hypothetical protein
MSAAMIVASFAAISDVSFYLTREASGEGLHLYVEKQCTHQLSCCAFRGTLASSLVLALSPRKFTDVGV